MKKNIKEFLENIDGVAKKSEAIFGSTFSFLFKESGKIIRELSEEINELSAMNKNPSLKDAYNQGVEDAALVIEDLGTNNVGMVHELNRAEARRIRELKK